MEKSNSYSLIVGPSEERVRLDKYVAEKLKSVSRSQIGRLIESGQILLNQKKTKPSVQISPGDIVSIDLTEKVASQEQPLNFKLDIVFEDDDLLVVNKPSGISVHPGSGKKVFTLVDALKKYTKLSSGYSPDRPGIVHRLDNETSGLMVITKTDQAQETLKKDFKQKTVKRVYQAITHGHPPHDSGTIKSYLIRNPNERRKRMSLRDARTKKILEPKDMPLNKSRDEEKAKLAITHYVVKAKSQDFSRIELTLETGRTHQIRVHLTELGCPIVGDKIYFPRSHRKRKSIFGRCALHAKIIEFTHPITRKQLRLECEWPSDILEFLKQKKLL